MLAVWHLADDPASGVAQDSTGHHPGNLSLGNDIASVPGALLVGIYPAAISLTRAQAPRGMESRVLAYGTSLGALGIGGGPFVAGLVGPVLGLRAHFALNALVVLAVLLFWIRAMKNRP